MVFRVTSSRVVTEYLSFSMVRSLPSVSFLFSRVVLETRVPFSETRVYSYLTSPAFRAFQII